MTAKLAQLKARREELVALAAVQRVSCRDNLEPLRQPLARLDQVLAVIGYVKRHPSLIVGTGLVLLMLRRGPAGKWLGRGWVAWRTVQSLRSALAASGRSVLDRPAELPRRGRP